MEGDKRGVQNKNEQPTDFFEKLLVEEKKNPDDTQRLNPHHPREPDLDLSLCLGSIHNENTLTRSSSIAGGIKVEKDSYEPQNSFLSLERSCSLPTDAEQLQRMIDFRELQSMKKDEAKRWLLEGKGKEKSPLPPKVTAWPLASSSSRPEPTSSTSFQFKGQHQSQTLTVRGVEGSGTANVTSSFKSSSEPRQVGPLVTTGTNSNEKLLKPMKAESGNPFRRPRISYGNSEDNGMEIMRQMPSVSTTGDGPNGRKVEGFLYRYMKGNVSIMCVCHGSFLSPAEFVKHAGGRDVPNPMKHITVYSALSV